MPPRRALPSKRVPLIVGTVLCLAIALQVAWLGTRSADISANVLESGHTLFLPSIGRNYLDPAYRLSRFGVGKDNIETSYMFPLLDLRVGWYWDWWTSTKPERPGGVGYLHTVRLAQTGPTTYEAAPSLADLTSIVAANPGAVWMIGNEPDCRSQDDLEPGVYARAYHDLYVYIKGLDDTAQVSAAAIVQPTPIRLLYLDTVLSEYRALYGGQMPVDVWNIHMHVTRERDCAYHPEDCWGSGVPSGIGVTEGMLYEIDDNADVEIFKGLVRTFREWMSDNGYRERPLYITEFGVVMWPDYVSPERVVEFMSGSIDYLLTESDPTIGYPADNNRLVQRFAWYSLADSNFNGWLFDPVTKQRTIFGDQYAAIAAAQPATVNLYAWKLWVEPGSPFALPPKDPIRIYATIANNGSVQTRNAVAVRFYDSNPDSGGAQIGETQYIAPLDGGAGLATVSVPWTPTQAGTYPLYVRVDPSNNIPETDEGDNARSISVEVMGP
jgi:hypothetical protein